MVISLYLKDNATFSYSHFQEQIRKTNYNDNEELNSTGIMCTYPIPKDNIEFYTKIIVATPSSMILSITLGWLEYTKEANKATISERN